MKTEQHDIEITYYQPRHGNQDDPCFHTKSGHSWVATLRHGEKEIAIFCDGEMRINDYGAPENRTTDIQHDIRCSDDLIDLGFDTDEAVFEANENGQFYWVNNSWFDLYDAEGEHLDRVSHDLQDAINEAKELINEGENQ